MKTKILLSIFTLVPNLIFAQHQTGIVKLRGTRLTYPLVNKWIAEFNKEYPGIKVSIAPTAPADSIDFSIASYPLKSDELKESQRSIIATRYVQLPVVNSNRPGLAELQSKGITEKELGEIFFKPESTLLASSQKNVPIDLYVRDRPVCAVKSFADHFGADPKKIKGDGIKGDDQDLAKAVKKDVNGFSFNNLGFIYNTKTRKVVDSLAIIPLDLNSNGKVDKDEQIYNTLDEVIAYVERTKSAAFVNDPVNFIFNKDSQNKSAGLFLSWVLTKGQKFNHELGFINQETEPLESQKKIASSTFAHR
jgi:phosphate transport system substrate-binding protein